MSEPSITDDVRAEINARLAAIERDEDVRILFAVESGSRAWGFPSPDSDYDVRFVYVRKPDWYLSIEKRRDVIELPIEGDFDINGWDLKKALQLLIKPNPILLEWLRSPIVYRADPDAFGKLAALAERTAHLRTSRHHYLHLASSQYRRYLRDAASVPLKKYFYSLRPALALMWLRCHPKKPVPMDLPTLRAGVDLPAEVSRFIDEMITAKAKTKELGEGPPIAALNDFIEHEIKAARAERSDRRPPGKDLLHEANAIFRALVGGDA